MDRRDTGGIRTGGDALITKGRFFNAVDAHLRSPNANHLRDLRSTSTLFQIGLDTRIALVSDGTHIQRNILGNSESDPECWWPELPDKEEILRSAYIHAVELSLAHAAATHGPPLPIESLWIWGTEWIFEVIVSKSQSQITLVLITPKPPVPRAHPPVEHTFMEDVWVVSSEARLDQIIADHEPSHQKRLTKESIPGSSAAYIKKLRLLGY